MDTKSLIIRTVIIFIVLAFAGIGMALSAKLAADAFEQTILIAVGSAMFGAATLIAAISFRATLLPTVSMRQAA